MVRASIGAATAGFLLRSRVTGQIAGRWARIGGSGI